MLKISNVWLKTAALLEEVLSIGKCLLLLLLLLFFTREKGKPGKICSMFLVMVLLRAYVY